MFGYISVKKLKECMDTIRIKNRAAKLGQDYTQPIDEDKARRNVYLQGYEDGADNFYNVLCSRFNLRRHK